MKFAKQQSGKNEQASLQGSVKKISVGKKSQKSPGSQRKKRTDVSTQFGFPPKEGNYNSEKSTKPGLVCKLPSDIHPGETKVHHSSKIKLQLFPINEKVRMGLEKDGRNPFLELTLSARKKVSSILTHLLKKWGSSSIATGDLMLFPFNAVVENLTSSQSWSSRDSGITAGDVHSAIGSPEIFRLRYGWISHDNTNVGCATMEAESCAEKQAEMKSKELVLCSTIGLTDEPLRSTSLSKPLNIVVHPDQAVVTSEALQPSQNEIENDNAAEKHFSADLVRQEEASTGREHSQHSLFWSDLSNMSIGGLLSEASLQGRFNTSSTPDSMDAFINQLKFSNPSTNIDMPSSFLDAEDTCHSFGLSKPSAAKGFLSLGRSAFSELSGSDTASRPSRFSKSEANVQNDSNGCNAAQKPTSAGHFNNENSLGLSSIRWNDSLGPFDLPLIPQQIIKDDSISIGGFVR